MREGRRKDSSSGQQYSTVLLLLFNFHGNWLFIAEKCNLDIKLKWNRTLMPVRIPGPDRIPGNAFKIPSVPQISGTSMAADEGGGAKTILSASN